MLYQVQMIINIPLDFDPAEANRIKAAELAYSQELQRSGEWRHIWRVAGQYANLSILDVASHQRLHEILMGLPLYRFMDITVTPLCRHPSAIREDDT